ncbi:YeeE/YedE thiosulfate transporter family protein [uncultured Desulfobulbus sp.]|uniref:YeeE/YedE thiosulfate transporter family protein n=1 Tax=uncultured Desulfobulbus sp. TaxID=239745 RepID=UPI0029C754D9|nr:YeeE/YedE thiosulfate transporter family protein [uncultured Desulfobulbus sp.]
MIPDSFNLHERPGPYANPYLTGILLGLVLLASFLILGVGLGASGGIARIGAWLSLHVSAPHTLGSEYFGNWGDKPLSYYLVFMFVGTFVGALFSAFLNKRVSFQVERGAAASISIRLLYALAGGVIVGFASRLARGCTSGQGLTGGALLLTGSFVFLLCIFVSGYATAWLFRGQWND